MGKDLSKSKAGLVKELDFQKPSFISSSDLMTDRIVNTGVGAMVTP